MCVTSIRNTLPTPATKVPGGEAAVEIKINIPVFEVDNERVEDVNLTVTNHLTRRDYVVIQKGGLSLTISTSDMERAIQAARLAHRV